jgi:hypothetical protein
MAVKSGSGTDVPVHYVIMTYETVEVQIHSFLNFALTAGDLHPPAALFPGRGPQ